MKVKLPTQKMGGVDLTDQMTYDINRKSQKLWSKVYYKILMMAAYNLYIVFKEATHKKVSFIQYLVPLAAGLIAEGRKGVLRKRTRKVGRHSSLFGQIFCNCNSMLVIIYLQKLIRDQSVTDACSGKKGSVQNNVPNVQFTNLHGLLYSVSYLVINI
ncbi:hypothetical protein HUJ05_008715 [Dendroctonus ponderosae]|nr:hypothetical protein HUJ05_008715 [Dendroctonus ponderosae]